MFCCQEAVYQSKRYGKHTDIDNQSQRTQTVPHPSGLSDSGESGLYDHVRWGIRSFMRRWTVKRRKDLLIDFRKDMIRKGLRPGFPEHFQRFVENEPMLVENDFFWQQLDWYGIAAPHTESRI